MSHNQAYEDLWSYHKDRLWDLGFTEPEARKIVGWVYFKACKQDATKAKILFERVWCSEPRKEDVVRFLRKAHAD